MSKVHAKLCQGAEILPEDIDGIDEVRLPRPTIIRSRAWIDWSLEVARRMEAVTIDYCKRIFAQYLPGEPIHVATVEQYRAEENEPTVCVAWSTPGGYTSVIIAPSRRDLSLWGAYKVTDNYSTNEWSRDLDIDLDSVVPEHWSIPQVIASLTGYILAEFILVEQMGKVHTMEVSDERDF